MGPHGTTWDYLDSPWRPTKKYVVMESGILRSFSSRMPEVDSTSVRTAEEQDPRVSQISVLVVGMRSAALSEGREKTASMGEVTTNCSMLP